MKTVTIFQLNESAKSRAWRACVLACFACLLACVFTCSVCLRAWRVCVLTCLTCLRAWCAYVCTCVLLMMKYFIFLRVCVLGVLFCLICFTFQYLNLKILSIVCFVRLKIFLIYILIPTKAISIFYNLYIHLLH